MPNLKLFDPQTSIFRDCGAEYNDLIDCPHG